MPIFKINSNLIYFSQIPKCAGTSIKNYVLKAPDCSLAFEDRRLNQLNSSTDLMKSSQRYPTGEIIANLFDEDFFSDYFAVLREPIDRFKSSFVFQKYIEKKIDENMDINSFINKFLSKNHKKVGWFDNHFLPQISFLVPKRNYKLFTIEKNGIINLKKYIDRILVKVNYELELPHDNNNPQINSNNKDDLILNSESINILENIYKYDVRLYKRIKANDHFNKKINWIKVITLTDNLYNNQNDNKFEKNIETSDKSLIVEEYGLGKKKELLANLKTILNSNKEKINDLKNTINEKDDFIQKLQQEVIDINNEKDTSLDFNRNEMDEKILKLKETHNENIKDLIPYLTLY